MAEAAPKNPLPRESDAMIRRLLEENPDPDGKVDLSTLENPEIRAQYVMRKHLRIKLLKWYHRVTGQPYELR